MFIQLLSRGEGCENPGGEAEEDVEAQRHEASLERGRKAGREGSEGQSESRIVEGRSRRCKKISPSLTHLHTYILTTYTLKYLHTYTLTRDTHVHFEAIHDVLVVVPRVARSRDEGCKEQG
jgi:hypothetical protein